ncbi:barstar family protein [Nonomuraea sp. NPDC049758]|uniref:barstar family protein n=1 Tax=Nonomuraea sp. NPDC049758 TaxID=3154360 RepID=UPI00343B66C8
MSLASLVERLSRAESPWVYKIDLVGRPDACWTAREVSSEVAIVCFDAGIMTTLEDFFEVVADGLSFPDYFGHNWPAFDECLADVYEWLSVRTLVLLFVNSEMLLSHDQADLPTLIRIIEKVARELAEEISEGQSWDRPSVALHAVFDWGIEATAVGGGLPQLEV